MFYVYFIKNVINNKFYVGQSKLPFKRVKGHFARSKKNLCSQRPLQRAIRKHGLDNFVFFIVAQVASEEEVDELEIAWIKALRTNESQFGYNLESGGNRNKHMHENSKMKIRERMLQYYQEHESSQLGVVRSEEYCANLREGLKKRKPRKQTDETKKKLAERQRERWKRYRESLWRT